MSDLATYSPDRLLAGNAQCQTKEVVINTGNLARGSVLAKLTVGAVPTTGTANGGNTGNGTMTGVAGKRRVKLGTYTVTMLAAAANGGSFRVTRPDGSLLGVGRVGSAFVSDELDLTVNDGSTDYAAGDSFTVAVPANADAGKYVLADKDNIDGSGVAECILAESVDATSADKTTIAYTTGQFNADALIVGTGDTVADHQADLRVNDIHLKSNVVAA